MSRYDKVFKFDTDSGRSPLSELEFRTRLLPCHAHKRTGKSASSQSNEGKAHTARSRPDGTDLRLAASPKLDGREPFSWFKCKSSVLQDRAQTPSM